MIPQQNVSGPLEVRVMLAPSLHSGRQVVVGVTEAGDLVDRYVIPRRDTRNKKGYQREVSVARVNKLATELKAGRVNLPTAVLLNVRGFIADDLVERGEQLFLRLNGKSLYVVDGQHRLEALRKLVQEDSESWADFRVTFICLLGAVEDEEMWEFYVVNSTAKSVRTDLAYDLLKQKAESDPDVMSGLVESGQTWKVDAQRLVEKLEASSSIWRGRIRLPGEPKGGTTITSSGMVSSVKPLLAHPYFGAVGTDNQVRILDAFWQGVGEVLPDAMRAPEAYVLQKMTGTLVLHSIMIVVLEYVRSAGQSVLEPSSYAKPLEGALSDLQGDNREGEPVGGQDFWLAGPDGAAGSYSSNAGRRVLTAKIKARLPAPEVE